MEIPLADLDGKHVVVVIYNGKSSVEVETQGRYGSGKLELAAHDPCGAFTMILDSSLWNGQVSREPDGSYTVWLST